MEKIICPFCKSENISAIVNTDVCVSYGFKKIVNEKFKCNNCGARMVSKQEWEMEYK